MNKFINSNILSFFAFSRMKFLNIYLLLSFFVIVISLIVKFPSHGTNAVFFAEAGTNFFSNSHNNTFLESLKIPEVGYLPLSQRLLSEGIYFFSSSNLQNIPNLYGFAGLGFVAFFCSIVNLSIFRLLIRSDFLRFILSLHLAFFPDYDIFAFINFIYFGFIIITFSILLKNFNKIYAFFFGFLSFLIVTSKALLLSFSPTSFIMLLLLLKRNSNKKILLLFLLFGSILQSLYSLYFILQNNSVGISKEFLITIGNVIVSFMKVVVFSLLPWVEVINSFFLYSLFSLIVVVVYLFSNRNKVYKRYISIIIPIILISLFLFEYLIPSEQTEYLQSSEFFKPDYIRWYFIPYQLMAILLFLFADRLLKYKRYILLSLILFILSFRFIEFGKFEDVHLENLEEYRNEFNSKINNPCYRIPLNPHGWYLEKSCNP